jgi:Rrf2 family protein
MISNKTKYGLKALGHLATNYGKGPLLISVIAKEKNIPLKFLEAILLKLKQEGIVESRRGKGGGYLLAYKPATISLARIYRILEGPISLLPCVSLYFYKPCEDCDPNTCMLRKVMIKTRDATLAIWEKKSLKDLIDER